MDKYKLNNWKLHIRIKKQQKYRWKSNRALIIILKYKQKQSMVQIMFWKKWLKCKKISLYNCKYVQFQKYQYKWKWNKGNKIISWACNLHM